MNIYQHREHMQIWREDMRMGAGRSRLDRWAMLCTTLLRQKFLRDVGILTVANGTSAVFSLVQGLLLAHWLGPEQFGIAALIMSYPALLFTLLDSRSNAATVKFLSEFHAKGERLQALALCRFGYMIDAAIALLTFLLVAATAWWAEAYIVHTAGIAPLMLVYALAFVPRALANTSGAALSVLGRFTVLAWVEVLTTALRVAVTLGLVMNHWGIAGVIWGNVVGMITSGVLLAAITYKPVKDAWGAFWLLAPWGTLGGRRREILRFLLWTNFSELLGLVVKQLDLVVLGYFRGPQEVGYYKLAKSLAATIGTVVGPLESVTYARLAALTGAHRQAELSQVLRTLAFRIGLPAGMMAGAGLWLVPGLLSWVADASFVPATRPAQLLLACSIIWLMCFWLRPLYFAQSAMKSWTLISGSMVAISLIGLPVSAYVWGGMGIATWQLGIMVFSYSAFVILSIHHFRLMPGPAEGSKHADALLG